MMQNHNYQQILNSGNQHLDAPATVVLWLMIMTNLDYSQFRVWQHTDSSQIVNNSTLETTSYFELAY